MKNKDLRARMAANGVLHWQLAKEAGISASMFCVWLREELAGERLDRVTAALERILLERGRSA